MKKKPVSQQRAETKLKKQVAKTKKAIKADPSAVSEDLTYDEYNRLVIDNCKVIDQLLEYQRAITHLLTEKAVQLTDTETTLLQTMLDAVLTTIINAGGKLKGLGSKFSDKKGQVLPMDASEFLTEVVELTTFTNAVMTKAVELVADTEVNLAKIVYRINHLDKA